MGRSLIKSINISVIKNIIISIVISFFLACSDYLMAEPVVSIKKETYAVGGSTPGEIRTDLNERTPIYENGQPYDAYTRWHVNWRFWWDSSGGVCRITDVIVSLDVAFTFPDLMDKADLPPKVRRRWERYMTALVAHENGHKSIGVRAAEEIENRLWNLPPRSDCTELENQANAMGHSVMKKYIQMEKAYDRKTRHGMNDGAVFP